MDRQAQRQRILLVTAIPVAVVLIAVLLAGFALFPATTPAGSPTATPAGRGPTPTVGKPATVAVVNPTAAPTRAAPTAPPPTAPAVPPPPPTESPVPPPPPPPPPTNTTAPPPPAPPPTNTAAPPAPQTYTVAPGDTLPAIAAKLGVSLAAMMKANNLLNPADISAGQVLKIPTGADLHPTEIIHRVHPGETISGIAALYGVSQQAILDANGISNPNLVYAGTDLRITLK